VSGQLHAPAALSPEKEPLVPIGQEAGCAHRLFGRGGEEKNSQPPPGIELLNLYRPARSQSLYRQRVNLIKLTDKCSETNNAVTDRWQATISDLMNSYLPSCSICAGIMYTGLQ